MGYFNFFFEKMKLVTVFLAFAIFISQAYGGAPEAVLKVAAKKAEKVVEKESVNVKKTENETTVEGTPAEEVVEDDEQELVEDEEEEQEELVEDEDEEQEE